MSATSSPAPAPDPAPEAVSAGETSSSRAEHLRASPPLLPWPALDRFTRVHHLVPVGLFAPVVVLLAALAFGRMPPLAVVGLAVAGYLVWTLFEYWLHRVVFHWEPEQGIGARLHFLIHGVHHEHPNDPLRLVMPPSASIPLAALVVLGIWLVVPGDGWLAVSAGFLAGYLVYDEMHFWLHHHVPRTKLGRSLRERHMRHHFQDDTRGFGISAPYWDRVFGTSTVPRRAPRRADRSR